MAQPGERTSPTIAIVAAWRKSAVSKPVKVAPTIVSRPGRRRSGEVPPVSLPWKLAPAVPSVGTSTARASMPGFARLLERLAGGGDLGVGEGDARRADALRDRLGRAPEQVLGGDPGLVLAHVGEERAAVDVADRVEPLAAADPQPVVGLEEAVLVGLDAGGLEAEVGGVGHAADRDQDLRRLDLARRRSSSTTTPGAAGRDRVDLGRRCGRRRRSARAATSATSSPANGSSRESRCSPPSIRVTCVPRLAQAWESSLPTGPPPSTIMLSGTRFGGGRVAVVPGLDRVEPVDRRHRRPAAGRDDDRLAAHQHLVADGDPALALEARLAAEEVDPAFFQPGQLPGVVAVVDHLVAAVEDRLRLELPVPPSGRRGRGSPRPARRPAAAAPSRACRRSRSIRRRSGARSTIATRMPPSASRPAQTSPDGPAPRTIAS